jgi:two-component system, NarL family, nitrate/nitrite response regulator NarL
MTRVLVAADVRLYRDGIARVLEGREGLEVVGTAADHDEAVHLAGALDPQVVVLDLGGDEGRRTVRSLAAAAPDARVVVLAIGGEDVDVVSWAEAGVAGYVTREESVDELADAVRAAAAGELICSPRMAGVLLRRVRAIAGEPVGGRLPLTGRELEIGVLLEQGLSNKEIAQALHIELTTVKNHVHRILGKLGATRRAEAAATIRRNRISV